MTIWIKHIKHNYSKRQGTIKYLVIHDTGNVDKGADAYAHFVYFNGGDRQSSAHYFVDDRQVLEVVDPVENRSWHCGDGKGKYGITNDNSIGIEMCINSDGDFNKTYKNTVELIKNLMDIYDIDIDHVVRHYDASRKTCPAVLINKTYGYSWDQFKKDIGTRTLYRVCVGSYYHIENARKKAKEVGGFIIEYNK